MTIQKIKSGRITSIEADEYIGEIGTIFYNQEIGDLRLSDGVSLGGIPINTGSGGGSGGNASIIVSTTPPSSSSIPGTLWWNPTTGNMYIRYANAWTSSTSIPNASSSTSGLIKVGSNLTISQDGTLNAILTVGPKGDTGNTGPKGNTGDQGPKGDTGLTGPQGATGLQGPKGDTGLTGPQGIQGDIGLTGPQGATGLQGIQGDIGLTGATGPQGIQGDIGLTGATGPQGVKGDTGLQGVKGDTGLTGATGPQGIQGIQGPAGTSGYTLPIASINTLGGVIIGTGLEISQTGILSATGGGTGTGGSTIGIGNLDGGTPWSNYGGLPPVDGGGI
jgi:hypothetical protein